jgi:alcohol dehydrogenase
MLPKYYEFHCPTKILCGRKAVANVPHELRQLGASRPLLVTDQGIIKAGLLRHVDSALADAGMTEGARLDDVPADSSVAVCNRGAALYREKGCDAILAVGGGSVIDTAKGINIVLSEGSDDLLQFQGVDRLKGTPKPYIAVPTTAGTGSEVTSAAVIFNEHANTKMGFVSARIFPHVAVVDPAMTLTMPARITAATGMDALTHATEAFIGMQKNPVSDAYATAAMRLVHRYIVPATRNGKNDEARLAMANAALLAGVAFDNSMVGLVHGLAHATGGVCHVPHGIANSIFLPWVLEYNFEKIWENLADMAALFGVANDRVPGREAAESAIAHIRDLAAQLKAICGLPVRLSDAGVKEGDLAGIAEVAHNEGALTYNREESDKNDIMGLLKKAF